MKSSDLNSYLSNKTSVSDLKKCIDLDVENYSNLIKKKGASIPLNFYDDGAIEIDESNLKKLLLETINEALSNDHLAYICDCLTLADNLLCENKDINNIIHDLADPEINRGYKSKSDLEMIVSQLK